ncbi:unnamed protein product [Meloidogyne enterolobii]|uniref:Uncharacterized protein n=1 Tax=Meloidogyne enterolobii TaxID=390850 RepID=A0ACB1B0L9_MELEN
MFQLLRFKKIEACLLTFPIYFISLREGAVTPKYRNTSLSEKNRQNARLVENIFFRQVWRFA